MANPLRLFEHSGVTYATGLFALHDTHGFSLADSIIECNRRGWYPCVEQFFYDALKAGWSRDKARQVVDGARADAAVV